MCGQHQVALVVLIRPAHRNAVSVRDARHAFGKALRQFIKRGGFGHQRRHLIQTLQALVLFFELRGLLRHLALQVAVHRLQVLGHAVEALGQGAEFVAGDALNAGVEIAALNFFDRLLELADWLQHEQVAGVEQHGRTQDGHRQHAHLQQVQHGGPVRHVRLNAGHESVDVGSKGDGLGTQIAHGAGPGIDPARMKAGPILLDCGKA